MSRAKIAYAFLAAIVIASCSPPPAKEAEAPPAAEPEVACAVNVSSAAMAAPAHGALLTASIDDAPDGLTYNWSTTAGSITNGQGTPAITVAAPAGEFVTVTVEVGGLPEDCQRYGSATLEIQ